MEEKHFQEYLKNVRIPVLVLDQKWHRLFALTGKPDQVLEKEQQLTALLQEQGKCNQEHKDLKRIKNQLMSNIVENMEGVDEEHKTEKSTQKIEETKRLLEETNSRMDIVEEQLLELPKQIKQLNDELMIDTMEFSYERLRLNQQEAKEIAEWITKIRIELKTNLIKKQNREINNKEIYSYMHDIFGRDVINLFDVKYEEDNDE